MKKTRISPSRLRKILTRYPLGELTRTFVSEPALLFSYYRRTLTVPRLPARMMIDPCNVCNLQCPLCPTGRRIPEISPSRMPYDLFEHIVSLNPRLRMLDLYNLGEPFLNKDIFRMLELCRRKGIRTAVHTNMAAYDTGLVERIVETPPTRLHLSVDGVRQETYAAYRRAGNLERVMQNMDYLSRRIRESGRGPSVEWAFLYHKGNEGDMDEARAMASRLGFTFYARPLAVPDRLAERWHHPETIRNEPVDFRSNVVCPHLWLQMTLRPNGALAFCCFGYLDADDLSEPLSSISTPEQLLELWNSGLFRRGRTCFDRQAHYREIEKPILCEKCTNYPRTGGLDPEKHPYETPYREWIENEIMS